MKRRNILLFLFFLLTTTTSFAQETKLIGKVVDATDKPIEFVNVFLKNNNGSLQTGTITDLNGNFQISIEEKGKYELVISFVGFEDWKKDMQIEETIDLENIRLQPAINELAEVVVSGERNIITRKEDKLIFNVATSPLKSGYDGMEVLQRSPNILVDTEGNILIRNEAPTILINGRISNLSGADLANYLSNLRSEDIKQLEIQTHLSANTDAESSGGVINIILKRKPVGFDGSIRSDYTYKGEDFRRVYGGTTFNYGAQKWNVYGTYNAVFESGESIFKNTTDYFTTQDLITSDEVFLSEFNRKNYSLGFVGDLAKNHMLGVEGFGSDLLYQFENTGQVNSFHQDKLIEKGVAMTTSETDAVLNNLTFNYTWTIDTANSSLKIFGDYANQAVTRTNTSASAYTQGVYTDNTARNIAPANTVISSLQADLENYFRKGLKLETGVKFTNTDRENTLLSDILVNQNWTPTNQSNSYNYAEQVLAAYVGLSKNLDAKTFLEIGLRVENTDLKRVDLEDNEDNSIIKQDYTNWFPSFFLAREVDNNRSISLTYSKRLRRPPFPFLNNNVIKINDFRYELGNPDLIPENVHNVAFSWKEKKQNIDFYIRRTTNAINGIYSLEGQIAYYQKYNEGIQQQIGMSYNRYGNLTTWWYIKALVSIYNRKFIDAVGEESFNRTTARFNISNNFKLNETTTMDLIGSYISPHEDAYYIAYERYRVNWMLQKTFFNKQLICRVYINDLFNTLNYRAERPFENFKTTRLREWRTRSLRLWVSYKFNGKNKVNNRKNQSNNEASRRL